MVELTVALLAGLIVAMGIVALSREATNTFHEEARVSVAEASLRAAMDRLRGDLQRAGYMSTGNIATDPNLATLPGQTNTHGISPTLVGIVGLQSILLVPGESNNVLPLSAQNGLAPDQIEISGNFTTADSYDVAMVMPAGSSGTCQKIYMSATSPAMVRLLSAGNGELQVAFQPDNASQFIVRLVDDSGRSQFLVTCAGPGAAGIDPANQLPYINVDTSSSATPLRTAAATGTVGGLSGYAAGRAWVNPVQTVHWAITTTSNEPLQYQNALLTQTGDGGVDPTKYDLVRSYYDALHQPVVATTEVIAEYAADLKFAFSVAAVPPTPVSAQATAPTITTYAFGDPQNAVVASAVAPNGTAIPQRIRSIRARIVTRTGQADRTAFIGVQPASTESYLYRYCVVAGGCAAGSTTAQWAQARTLTTEVSLPNQAKSFY
ncbi:MAG: hypothetical protein ABSC94_02015 [Polyangiaceae bacterium]|jgi:Tfp pilus assembly protein PilW